MMASRALDTVHLMPSMSAICMTVSGILLLGNSSGDRVGGQLLGRRAETYDLQHFNRVLKILAIEIFIYPMNSTSCESVVIRTASRSPMKPGLMPVPNKVAPPFLPAASNFAATPSPRYFG